MEQDRQEPLAVDEREAARLCGGVSRSTLRSWRSQGRGPRFARLGRRIVYRLTDLRDFLNESISMDGRA
jgi:hypothetical protein